MLKKLAAFPLAASIVLSAPLQALAQQTQAPASPAGSDGYYWRGPMHMWGPGYDFYGWHSWTMFPGMILFLIVLCGAVFLVARWGFGHQYTHGPHHWNDPARSALQILNERFARGEIQKAEYEEKKAAIVSGR